MNTPRLRLVRLAPDPLGLYIRAGRIGSKDLQNFIASGVTAFNGVVFEAKRLNTQRELLSLVIDKGLDAVLDPQTQAMATPGGYTANMAKLPWGSNAQQTVADFSSPFLQKQIAESIAEFAISNGFTQVLSPTHFISGPDDPWLPIDLAMTKLLRNALDRKGGAKVEVQYSLATTYVTFRTKDVRQKIVSQLATASINGLWLNISGCGSDSSPTAITRYAEAATDFHALSIPIIADHAGGLMGLSLLAFGAVGGLSHGITGGERFDVTSWFNPSTSPSFGQKPRIYISNLDLLIEKVDAEKFFEAGGGRAKTAFGCRNTNCCHRGVDDMLQAPIGITYFSV